jgi:hypothetical protein
MKIERIQGPLPYYNRKQLKTVLNKEIEVETVDAVDPDAEKKKEENNQQAFDKNKKQEEPSDAEKHPSVNIVV